MLFGGTTFKCKYYPMPHYSCMIVFENMDLVKTTEEKLSDQNDRISQFLERAVDIMLAESHGEDSNWTSSALKK